MVFAKRPHVTSPRLPTGERLYAIGEIHGERVLLEHLLAKILLDSENRGKAKTTLILLGNVIDHGPDAAGLLITLQRICHDHLVMLQGNHEYAMASCYRGNEEAVACWLRFGGRSTLSGFGISEQELASEEGGGLVSMMRSSIDPKIIEWIEHLPSSFERGDYYFAHAGIHPGVLLRRQDPDDLIWIREPFLPSAAAHGKIIVHGHTIEEGVPQLGGNRIGLDTGADEFGQLSALGLEGDHQWILQATRDVDEERGAAPTVTSKLKHSTFVADCRIAVALRQFEEIERLISKIIGDANPRSVTNPLENSDGNGRETALPTPAQAADPLGERKLRTPALILSSLICVCAMMFICQKMPWHGETSAPVSAYRKVPVIVPYVAQSASDLKHARMESVDLTSTKLPHRVDVIKRAPALREQPPERLALSSSKRFEARKTVKDTSISRSPPPPPPEVLQDRSVVAVHLTGAALDKALAEDRLVTQRLNQAEILRIAVKP